MGNTAAVITVSDTGARGERIDTSGPAVCDMLEHRGWKVEYTKIIPDDLETIKKELIFCADEKKIQLVLTTGGTGFSPRDVTPEATLAVIDRRTPGIPELMRGESVKRTDRGCLSRAEAGIRGSTLIVNLPGSETGARENLQAVLEPIRHGVEMILSNGSAECASNPVAESAQNPPSMDRWLQEAKTAPSAPKVGMYLIHSGTVRETAKASVRQGMESTARVVGMAVSYDKNVLDALITQVYQMPGIYYVRAWINEGKLQVGEDIMLVLIGGDIRPHVVEALNYLVSSIKNDCILERELYS